MKTTDECDAFPVPSHSLVEVILLISLWSDNKFNHVCCVANNLSTIKSIYYTEKHYCLQWFSWIVVKDPKKSLSSS